MNARRGISSRTSTQKCSGALDSALTTKCQIGTGFMDRVWHGGMLTVAFLKLGATRRLLFPEHGSEVPFTISSHAYRDSFGRETVTWSRRYQCPY